MANANQPFNFPLLIPIQLGISTPRATNVGFWSLLNPHLKDYHQAILHRDSNTCRFCGFRSGKFQEVVVRRGEDWNLVAAATACIFCAQCLTLERVTPMRSGVLLWAPEINQTRLHHLARTLYTCRISQGVPTDKARTALDSLMQKRHVVREKIGTDDPWKLLLEFQDCDSGESYHALLERIADVRLFPLDRRIVQEGDLEFNQFPQILAFWRSKAGPMNVRPNKMDLSLLDEYLQYGKV